MRGVGKMAVKIEKKRELGSQCLLLTHEEDTENTARDLKSGTTGKIGTEERKDFREIMMLKNKIHGHLPFKIRRINGKKSYEYNIEGLSSLEEEALRKLDFEKIEILARGVSEIIEAGAPFLLKEEDYVITPGTIFFDKQRKDLKLVYCPGYGRNLKAGLADIMEYCLDMIDYNDGLAVRSAYGLYMKLRDGCSLRQLKETVERIAIESQKTFIGDGIKADDNETGVSDGIKTDYKGTFICDGIKTDSGETCVNDGIKAYDKGTKKWNRSKYPAEVPALPEGKRTPVEWIRDFLDIADKQVKMTVVICAGAYIILTLAVISGKIEALRLSVAGIPVWIPLMIAMAVVCVTMTVRSVRPVIRILKAEKETKEVNESNDDNETVLMIGRGTEESLVLVSDGMPGLCTDRFPCVIGKDKASCDLVVDARGVSRKHLRIDRNRDGGVTVEDLNTINGTYLNGHKLAPNMSFEVREGDEITFGNVSYYINHLE